MGHTGMNRRPQLNTVTKLTRALAPAAIALFAAMGTTGVSATYNHSYSDWDVSADPGTYGPISLGDTITLDACGSVYFNYDNQSQSVSLCDISSLSSFTLTWKAKIGNNWTHITQTYSGNNTADGLNVTVNTGAGTFFNQAGTYMIGLYLTVNNNSWVQLPGGSWGYSNNSGGYDPGNQSLEWSSTFTVSNPPANVPEPMAALLLVPGLVLIARRERRRRKQQHAR